MSETRIAGVGFLAYDLPLRQCWRSAAGDFGLRRGGLLYLRDGAGRRGWGDCAPLPEAGTESLSQARAALARELEGMKGEAAELLARLPVMPGRPAARAALEMALLDLAARQQGVSVARWLNPRAASSVAVNRHAGALIGEGCGQEAGSGVVKWKAGLAPVAEELARLRYWATACPGMRFRLDANRAWSLAEARRFIEGCADLPLESIEEPLRDPDFDALRRLQALAGFPLALDESLAGMDRAALLAAAPVRRLVFKPAREGGLLPVLERARQARSRGMECVVTTTVDSAIGVWAAVHLAAALEGDEDGLAHGLATSDWLREDLAPAPRPRAGRIYLPVRPGFGIDPDQIFARGTG